MENTIAEATIDVIDNDADASSPLDTTDAALLDDEQLVEEISIDGMCGVY
jgi:mycofactocin precursor